MVQLLILSKLSSKLQWTKDPGWIIWRLGLISKVPRQYAIDGLSPTPSSLLEEFPVEEVLLNNPVSLLESSFPLFSERFINRTSYRHGPP
jgi:hypothetical protein